MLREGWNFHNDIAIPLEHIAKKYYRDMDRPRSKIYDADFIESGNYVEVMIILLRNSTKMNNGLTAIDEFVQSCAPYLGVSGNAIPCHIAQELFDRFSRLYH